MFNYEVRGVVYLEFSADVEAENAERAEEIVCSMCLEEVLRDHVVEDERISVEEIFSEEDESLNL